QELGNKVQVQFTPHVGPYTRGILSTTILRPSRSIDVAALYKCYDNEPFVRVLPEGQVPDLSEVRGSNFCDISLHVVDGGNLLEVVSAIDNMVKGAAGQAVQNMNLMYGFAETAGIDLIPAAF
ncbi:MAG TPA: Asd/ArgC dimerization domain-containing protein, partial [Treponemataceae bacterium]|nr:Asd/ArgC dimerization domain-containing protein [Treponemataceae bacterium]